MATDLETRSTSKPDAYLRRKFAELCARIKRADLIAHLLTLSLAILCYALFVGLFDWFAGNSSAVGVQATRWLGFGAFLVTILYLLMQTARCLFRRVNPYYVAQQIESASPSAKNTLINWLDMQDEAMPAAFQRNLSARAAEQLQESDVDKTVQQRKNGLMLGLLAAPALGLVVLMLLGPSWFAGSMVRAFVPFYTPPALERTRITLVQPEAGDAEVSPTQAITLLARIDGSVPVGNRPDAPKLSYRYSATEDYLTQSLQQDADGLWTTQLHAGQIRTGFTYKISAGDAETPEHQVRVRGRAHVKKFEVTYRHRPYRQLKSPMTVTFPNEKATRPIVHGPRGSEVELVIHTSRPVKKLAFETATGEVIVTRKLSEDSFTCQWKLDQPGQFRVAFTSADGEENADRDYHPIDVQIDDAPSVLLDKPGKDVQLPANGTLVLEGRASSHVGVKEMTLHLRVLSGPDKNVTLLPWIYGAGKSFQLDDGTFQHAVEYHEVVPLDQLPISDVTTHSPPAGTVLEYWLEATDATDYPNPAGNVGTSAKYKVTLTPPANASQEESKRKNAEAQKKAQQKKQEEKRGKENKDRTQKAGNGGGAKDPQKQLDAIQKQKNDTGSKLCDAMKQEDQNKGNGKSKPATPQNSDAKGGPPDSPDGPQPKDKSSSMPPENNGNNKEQGDGKDKSGESKGDGKKSKDDAAQGSSKGVEQNGPEKSNKHTQADQPPPPNAKAKNATKAGAGDSKSDPKPASPEKSAERGAARGDDAKSKSNEEWDELARHIERLPSRDANGDEAGEALAEIAAKSDDSRKRDIAKAALAKNGRDPKTGKELKKGPSPVGTSSGKSPGLSDELKTAAANREFAARIGQMQLDDWQKRISPELLKRAGVSEDEWQRYLKNTQAYADLVRDLNAMLAREALKKDLRGGAAGGYSDVQNTGTRNTALEAASPWPPELQPAMRKLTPQK